MLNARPGENMDQISYVSEGSAAIARSMERELQKLPKEAGIIFIAVQPSPVWGGVCRDYHVILGVDNKLAINQTTVDAIAQVALKDYPPEAYDITMAFHFGVTGMCNGK